MRGFWTVWRRELAALFLMPLAWIVLCIALPLNGALFVATLQDSQGDLAATFKFMLGDSLVLWVFAVALPPLFTMRMISEEARSGVLEYVLTAPVTDAAVVCGKLGAAVTWMALFWSSFLVYGLACQLAGAAPEWPALLVQVFGATLVSALFTALGLLCSAATATPLVAAVLSFVGGLGILALPYLGSLTGLPPEHWVHRVLLNLNVMERYWGSFGMGVLDSAHLCFFAATTALLTFFAVRLVESRRWR